MNTHQIFIVFIASTTLFGCASGKRTTAALNLGPDTYSVRGYDTEDAINAGNQHCAAMSKKILVTNITESNSREWGSIIFRCLNEGDPDYTRPDYRKPPSTVIEDKRR